MTQNKSSSENQIHHQPYRELNRLEPLSPEKGNDMYLSDMEGTAPESTHRSHRSRLGHFVDWCKEQGITNLNELTGRKLHRYRVWRRDDGELNITTEKTEQDTLRVFIRWCESVDAVPTGLSSKVVSPSLSTGENSRDVMVSAETTERILDFLDTYHYASLEHCVWHLLARIGCRMGTAQALDKQDYHSNTEQPYLKVRHRAGETRLKNTEESERLVFLFENDQAVLDDYLRDNRPDVQDEYDREPLLATKFGRIAGSTIRKYAYKWTRPCQLNKGCPHNRSLDECEAAGNADRASKCPSSKSPHPIRRGYLSTELASGVPQHVLSDRCDVSEAVLDEHYDQRSEERKMIQRKQLIEQAHQKGSSDEVEL